MVFEHGACDYGRHKRDTGLKHAHCITSGKRPAIKTSDKNPDAGSVGRESAGLVVLPHFNAAGRTCARTVNLGSRVSSMDSFS